MGGTVHPASPHLGQTIDDYVARRPRSFRISRPGVEAHLCPHGTDASHEHPTMLVLDVP